MNLLKKCRYGLMLYNNSDIWIGKSIENYGEFSETEVELFRNTLQQGSVVADIGANIGCHSIAFSRIVGPTGFVFSYEPERHNFYTLCANIALNNIKNIHAFQRAMGSFSGKIAVPELDLERTVNFGGLSLDEDYSNSNHYDVELFTLDQVGFTRIDFIKIDVEGMEKKVLDGCEKTIKKNSPILYVENDRPEKSEELISKIKSMGYVVYEHRPPLFNIKNYYENQQNLFIKHDVDRQIQIVSINLYCHHESRICPVNPDRFGLKLLN